MKDEIETKVEETLDKIEQVRQMGPKVRYKIGEIIRKLLTESV